MIRWLPWQWLPYLLLGRLFNRPATLTALMRIGQRIGVPIACSHGESQAVFRRGDDFSNRAHFPNLVAGDFVIGMDSGPQQAQERAAAHSALPTPERFGQLASEECRRRIESLRQRLHDGDSFDLIDDYLVFAAWAGLRGVFDDSAAEAIEAVPQGMQRDAALASLFAELRYVGGHLIVGGIAPHSIQRRAQNAAAALNERVARALVPIRADWQSRCPMAAQAPQRQAVGLMWVGHPAMVQAGAFVFQQLRSRPEVYGQLREQVGRHAGDPFSDAGLHEEVLAHVLECLRLAPPFPLLSRLLPREADLEIGAGPWARQQTLAAGKTVYLATAAALRDPKQFPNPEAYDPARALRMWRASADQVPIFGIGQRACIARHQVVELLASATIGLLCLPELEFADRGAARASYDGPIVVRMLLRAAAQTSR